MCFYAKPTATDVQSGGKRIGKAHGLSVIADMPTVHIRITRRASRDSLLWSMVLSPNLILPPKYAKREPALRKKRGRPTEKRVERLTEQQKEVDARPFVDKAPPRVSAYG